MARDFVPNSTLQTTSPPITSGTAMTMACWFNADNITAEHNLMNISIVGSDLYYIGISARGDVAGDPIEVHFDGGTSGVNARTSTGYSASTWHHACAVQNSTSSRDIYLDGAGKASNTTTRNQFDQAVDRYNIGVIKILAGNFGYTDGRIAEVAIWNVALTEAEVISLSKGFSPLLIRPASLVDYRPLIRTDLNLKSTSTLTVEGTPLFADHPRIIYPSSAQIRKFGAATAAASIPNKIYQVRQAVQRAASW